MSEQEIYEKIVAIIKDRQGKDFQVSRELSLKDDLQADSVDLMEFILTLEDEFVIEIPDEDVDNLESVADVIACVERKLSEA